MTDTQGKGSLPSSFDYLQRDGLPVALRGLHHRIDGQSLFSVISASREPAHRAYSTVIFLSDPSLRS